MSSPRETDTVVSLPTSPASLKPRPNGLFDIVVDTPAVAMTTTRSSIKVEISSPQQGGRPSITVSPEAGKNMRQSSSMALTRTIVIKGKRWYHLNFERAVRLAQILLVCLYTIPILITVKESGTPPTYCPSAVVCSTGILELVLLFISKISALLMYPPLAVIVLSKYVAELMNLYGLHEVHTEYGAEFFSLSMLHTIAHLIRYGIHDVNLYRHMNIATATGIIAAGLVMLICIPFMFEAIRKRISFEVRKNMHRLAVPFLVCLILHHFRLYRCGIALLVTYVVDTAYCILFKTVRVDDPHLFPIGNHGSLIEFTPPDNFEISCGQYVQICAPYISEHEFHPFSVIPVTTIDGKKACSFYVAKCGDWTTKLHEAAKDNVHRPIWVNGPYPSPFDRSGDFDYIFLVCMGVGITPGISLISQYWATKTIVLIWVCRNQELIDLYHEELQAVECKVFHTGKKGVEVPPTIEGSVIYVHGYPDLKGEIKNTVIMSQPLAPFRAPRHPDAKTPTGHRSPRFSLTQKVNERRRSLLQTPTTDATERGNASPPPTTRYSDEDNNWALDNEREAMLAAMRGNQLLSKARMHRQRNERQNDVKPSDWLVLFCGNQPSIATDLKKYCKERNVKYKTEFFGSW